VVRPVEVHPELVQRPRRQPREPREAAVAVRVVVAVPVVLPRLRQPLKTSLAPSRTSSTFAI